MMYNMQGCIYLKDQPEPVECDTFTFGAKGLVPTSNGVKGKAIPLTNLKAVWGIPIPDNLTTTQAVYDHLKMSFC